MRPERASSRRIRRDQSSAPVRIQLACVRARSAASTWIARHCCHTMPAVKVATSATIIIASSSAAPRCGRAGGPLHGVCGASTMSRVSVAPPTVRTSRTPVGSCSPAAAPRPSAGGRIARGLRIAPAVAAEEEDLGLAIRGAVSSTRSGWSCFKHKICA